MALVSASISWMFGRQNALSNGIAYCDQKTLIYVSGNFIVFYNMDQKTQRYMPLDPEGKGTPRKITAMAISANRKIIALAERGDSKKGEKPTISIFDLHTYRRKRILVSNNIQSEDYVSLAFSEDSRFVVSQGGEPDWILICFQMDKGKTTSYETFLSTSLGVTHIQEALFRPEENHIISVIGRNLYCQYRLSDGVLKPYGPARSNTPYTCHAWLNSEFAVVGTSVGLLLLFQGDELKKEFNLAQLGESDTAIVRITAPIDMDASSGSDSNIGSDTNLAKMQLNLAMNSVNALAAYSRGFACAFGLGSIFLYERTNDTVDYYKLIRQIVIQDGPHSDTPTSRTSALIITSIVMSPSEEALLCSTSNGEIYEHIQPSNAEKLSIFKILHSSFNCGQITGLDLCLWKQMIVTCSTDKVVRLWNLNTCQLELFKQFPDETLGIAVHPTGLMLAVCFGDNLCLVNVLIDDFQKFKIYPLRRTREVRFSHGGQYFSVVVGNIIQVYSLLTFDIIANFRGHDGRITKVVWTHDDSRLISCGKDGAVYEWSIPGGERVGENIVKTCAYSAVTVTPDGKDILAVGTDCMLKEISGSQTQRLMNVKEYLPTLTLSPSGKMLFGGTTHGSLRIFKFPFNPPLAWNDIPGHSTLVSRMMITYDSLHVVTVSDDTSMILWRILDKDGFPIKREKELYVAQEILITKSDLEEKNKLTDELNIRLSELDREGKSKLLAKDIEFNKNIKELTSTFQEECTNLERLNERLVDEQKRSDREHETTLSEIVANYEKRLSDQEFTNRTKLMLEYEKYGELERRSTLMQTDLNQQLIDSQASKDLSLEQLTETFEAKHERVANELLKMKELLKTQADSHNAMLHDFEIDADEEIIAVKTKYEQRLKQEYERIDDLKTQILSMKKKVTAVNLEKEEMKEDIRRKLAEIHRLTESCRSLHSEISDLKRQLQKKDEIIQDKETRAGDLRKMNQDLEKFQYVMDYRITNLEKQIEPKDILIAHMKEQIGKMESEAAKSQSENHILKRTIADGKEKLDVAQELVLSEQAKVYEIGRTLSLIKIDLHNCVGFIQEPNKLKRFLVDTYHKHVTEADIRTVKKLGTDLVEELNRQKDHLDMTVATKHKQLVATQKMCAADHIVVMRENVLENAKVNELQAKLTQERLKIVQLNRAMNARGQTGDVATNELLQVISSSTKNAYMERELKENRSVIELQRHEILKLQQEICALKRSMQLSKIIDDASKTVEPAPASEMPKMNEELSLN